MVVPSAASWQMPGSPSVHASPTTLPLHAATSSAEGDPRVPASLPEDAAALVSALEMEVGPELHPHTATATTRLDTDRCIVLLLDAAFCGVWAGGHAASHSRRCALVLRLFAFVKGRVRLALQFRLGLHRPLVTPGAWTWCPPSWWPIDPVLRHPAATDRAGCRPALRHSRGGRRLARVGAAPPRGTPPGTGRSAATGFRRLGGGRRRHRRASGPLALLSPGGVAGGRRSAASQSLGRPLLDGRGPRRRPRGRDLLSCAAPSILALRVRLRARGRARFGGGPAGMLLGARSSRAPHLLCAGSGIS